jgi:hypothetical protein
MHSGVLSLKQALLVHFREEGDIIRKKKNKKIWLSPRRLGMSSTQAERAGPVRGALPSQPGLRLGVPISGTWSRTLKMVGGGIFNRNLSRLLDSVG